MIFNYLFFYEVLRSKVVLFFLKYGRFINLFLECIVKVELLLHSMLGLFFRRLVRIYLEVWLNSRIILILHQGIVIKTSNEDLILLVIHILLGSAHLDTFRIINLSGNVDVDHPGVNNTDSFNIFLAPFSHHHVIIPT